VPLTILVKKGDRVAQLILERIITPEVLEVEVGHGVWASRWECG
jgi:dUTPase